MEINLIKQKLREALDMIIEKDKYLLEHDIHEPAISHRLAVYLEDRFPDFNIDCEYNGNIEADKGKKYIVILKDRAKQLGIRLRDNEENRDAIYRYVFPDVIIHKRGFNGSDNNLLVLEIKKSSNDDDGAWDAEKLSRFTSSEYENAFNYQYGAFIRFIVGENPCFSIEWYQNGQKLEINS